MSIRTSLFRQIRPFFQRHPRLKKAVIQTRGKADLVRHSAALLVPQIIRARPDSIFVTLTADCNQRCIGCRYGRDFMPGEVLPFPLVRDLLEDCKRTGIFDVRLYGGEPLLHKDLPAIIEHAIGLGPHVDYDQWRAVAQKARSTV